MLMKPFHRPLFLKLSQGLFPTNTICHQYDNGISLQCTAYHQAHEIYEHLFQYLCYAGRDRQLFTKIQEFFLKVSVSDKFVYDILLQL